MDTCRVTFQPQKKTVTVDKGTSLLEAASDAQITINNLCGGDGICGRCKMIVKEGQISGEVSGKLTREQIRKGYVLACITLVQTDLVVEIPEETLAKEKIVADKEAERFRDFEHILSYHKEYIPSPLVTKVYLELEPPSLANNTADHQRVDVAIKKKIQYGSMQMGLKTIKTLSEILRKHEYCITATVGMRRELSEVVVDAMARLRLSYRNILTLRCYEQMSYAEIAALMGCKELRARVLFFRAKHSLGRQLSRRGFGKGALLTALGVFGLLTAPTDSVPAAGTVSAASLHVGLIGTLAGTVGTPSGIVVAVTVAGVTLTLTVEQCLYAILLACFSLVCLVVGLYIECK